MIRTIGITGLIGSGKTVVSRVFGELGAFVINADEEGHKVLLKSGEAYNDVVSTFGKEILGCNGYIDRKKLGKIVFNDKTKLNKLNNLTHCHIINRITDKISQIKAKPGNYKGIVLEAIYLYEADLVDLCDSWVFINADEEIRLKRVTERDNMPVEAAKSRINSQKHLLSPEKLSSADFILENNETYDNFVKKTEELARHVFSLD